MRAVRQLAVAVSFVIGWLFAPAPTYAQIDINISVDIPPPPLPIYDQPPIPEPGYYWVPGYWAWDDDVGYYWVPGTWVLPPEPGLLWTPGYWGWDDGVYLFHVGYWGPTIGFYGGVVYGFGYDGIGYEGAYWRGGALFYNRTVNNFGNVSVTNVYNKTVIVNNVTNVSFNGGAGGLTARPTPVQLAAAHERHIAPTALQVQHGETAAKDPALALNNNHGHPTVAATAHPAEFKGPGVVAAHPGTPVAAVQPQGHRIVTRGKPGTPTNAPGTPGTATAPVHTLPNVHAPDQGGTVSGQPQIKRLPSTVARPPTPQISKPKPPPHVVNQPPPHVVSQPPPHVVNRPPPPPRVVGRPPPPPKKCPPGQRC